uniref:Uncharacterized protein n=1 Tax=Solanum lycopersicum TaxID=4081 RepID=A0A494G9H7_SOLLC
MALIARPTLAAIFTLYAFRASLEMLGLVGAAFGIVKQRCSSRSRMWWTITGNFGNILPIDWSKSCARKLHVPALNLNECKDSRQEDADGDADLADLSSEDEAVANDLDMHSLILSGLHGDAEPVKTADEVIREIDDMMQETPSHELSPGSEESLLDAVERKGKEVLYSPLYEESKYCYSTYGILGVTSSIFVWYTVPRAGVLAVFPTIAIVLAYCLLEKAK